jgi:hypothetical protein
LTTKEQESKALEEEFEKREAGVAELLEFYARVELVYVAASQALEQRPTDMTSNSANLK